MNFGKVWGKRRGRAIAQTQQDDVVMDSAGRG